ncbi:MAG TPA: CHAP domain-containing protein [Candidatus Saccharimonadales bacterium]
MVILGIITAVILFGSQSSIADKPLAATAPTGDQAIANPLDHVSSANIAETVARMSGLAETTAVTNQADSETTELAMVPTTSSVVDKPQVIGATAFASNKDIFTYTTVAGDTIPSIATKFGVTADSIRWSNNVTGTTIGVGVNLTIPPVTGIAYKVQAGDTAASLAAKFRADQNKIIAYNDAELGGLRLGELILIPDGSRAAAVASPATSVRWGGSATYGGYNGYDFGYCTYWVAKLRAQAGRPVPTNVGNASTWATRAAAMGLPTGTTPRVGAAVVTKTAGAGHVAYVTAVNDDGTITISEMNHKGWNKVNERVLPAASNYRYVY